jgi:hypothetical protein
MGAGLEGTGAQNKPSGRTTAAEATRPANFICLAGACLRPAMGSPHRSGRSGVGQNHGSDKSGLKESLPGPAFFEAGP